MSAHKRRYRSGQVVWYYLFDLPGTREERVRISASGFATKGEALDAEAIRRIDEQQKQELAKGAPETPLRSPRRWRCCWRSSFASMWTRSWHRRLSSATTSRRVLGS